MTGKPLACFTVLTAAGFLLALLLFFHGPVLQAIGDYLVIRDGLQPADVIHVSAGPDHRARYAIQLYQEGYGERIFFTGGRCQSQDAPREHRCADLAEREGIPKNAITVDGDQVGSTYDEAVRLKEFIARSREPVRSVIVVSDPHHTRRARWTYRRVLGDSVSVWMAPIPFEASPYLRQWWKEAASRSFVSSEYLKFIFYLLRY